VHLACCSRCGEQSVHRDLGVVIGGRRSCGRRRTRTSTSVSDRQLGATRLSAADDRRRWPRLRVEPELSGEVLHGRRLPLDADRATDADTPSHAPRLRTRRTSWWPVPRLATDRISSNDRPRQHQRAPVSDPSADGSDKIFWISLSCVIVVVVVSFVADDDRFHGNRSERRRSVFRVWFARQAGYRCAVLHRRCPLQDRPVGTDAARIPHVLRR